MSTAGRAQTLIPVPMTSVFAGEPAATYNGATSAGSICTSSGGLLTAASGYTWSNTYGDGCVPTQAHLGYPMGLTKDSSGNFYTADNYDGEVRVLYQSGTALAAAIVAGNPQAATFTPTAGHIYGFGRQTTAITASSGVYYCGGVAANGTATDAFGDGCPAYYGVYAPRDVNVDSQGNIFMTSGPEGTGGFPGVRVIYVQGSAAAALITAYNPTVTTPKPGYVYALSALNDFEGTSGQGICSIVIDSNENIYVSDNTASITTGLTGLGSTTAGGQIKKFSTTAVGGTSPGWLTYVAGTTTPGVNSTAGGADYANGDGGPASGAVTDQPTSMYLDANNNLYFAAGQDRRIRVVYSGGTTPPLYVVPTNTVVTPAAGNVYTVVGGVASIASGSQNYTNAMNSVNGVTSSGTVGSVPSSAKIQPQYIEGMGLDNSGNLIVAVSGYSSAPTNAYLMLNINQSTGGVTIFGGQSTSGATGTGWPTTAGQAAGTYCQSSTQGGTLYGGNGPVMTDAYGDGCPATMASVIASGYSRIFTDTVGNLYQLDSIGSSSTGGIIRQYTFAQSMGSVSVGNSTTTWIPYAFGKTNYGTAPTIVLGNSAFTDNTATDSCFTSSTSNASLASQTCTYSITFSPTVSGAQSASVTASSGSTSLGTGTITGTGVNNLPTAATPTFSPVAGTYTSVQTVTISDTTAGAAIYYTTNGTTPTTASTKYTSAITVGSTETVQAIAAASGYNNSVVASAAYTINLPNSAASPVFSPAAGTYTSVQTVTISDSTAGAALYYTTNGTTPTTSSTLYTGAITVSASETIEVVAVASGYNNSSVVSAIYNITLSAAATPTFSPVTGMYATTQSVTISDTTPGAVLYYTTDGTTPTASSTLYAGPVTVSASETIRAIAVAFGYTNSATASGIFTIGPLFTLSISSPTITITPNTTGTVPVSVAEASAFTNPSTSIVFTCSGLPSGGTCTSVPLTPSGATVTENIFMYIPQLTSSMRKPTRFSYVPEFAALLCLVCGWKKRRGIRLLVLAISLCCVASLLSGCSGTKGFSIESGLTDPQTITVTITGTSGTYSTSTPIAVTIP
jgi:hypothetical protein